jgi:hypothetical protein
MGWISWAAAVSTGEKKPPGLPAVFSGVFASL